MKVLYPSRLRAVSIAIGGLMQSAFCASQVAYAPLFHMSSYSGKNWIGPNGAIWAIPMSHCRREILDHNTLSYDETRRDAGECPWHPGIIQARSRLCQQRRQRQTRDFGYQGIDENKGGLQKFMLYGFLPGSCAALCRHAEGPGDFCLHFRPFPVHPPYTIGERLLSLSSRT